RRAEMHRTPSVPGAGCSQDSLVLNWCRLSFHISSVVLIEKRRSSDPRVTLWGLLPGAMLPQRRLDLRIPLGHCDERHGLSVAGCVDPRPRRHESIDDCGIVSSVRPAMDRPEGCPAERRAEVNWITRFDRDASPPEDRFNEPDVAHPACGVKR